MTSINKLVPSIASGSLEIAPALANLNFDFALWKVAAPKEFEGVGSALSASRREEAEGGMLHTIARKLGALFETKVPATPGLTKAYGTRASEIARAVSLDEKGRKSYGVFASRAGPDATSLWAAATSGTSAISIHLLACLLARIWDAPEAISIWVEVVKRRKEEVIAEFDETDIAHLATLAAARQDLPRAQIAEWDDSARAWLRIADTVKNKQQKQLMLILDNVQSPINAKSDTYDSVMEAWTSSLTQMEALVQGISQQAQSGEILLALSSWHLFPDLTVVNPSMAHVHQKDPVFESGGMLTIGLEVPTSRENGVHWSLPLAYLRHYGRPVVSTRSINSGSRSRLSLQELLQATLGSLLQKWGVARADTSRTLKWISSIYHMLIEATKLETRRLPLARNVPKHCWLALLSEAADHYLSSAGLERQHSNKLISLGRRQAHVFLGTPSEPNFGMLENGLFVRMITTEEDKINYLRKVSKVVAEQMRLDSSQIIIRYLHEVSPSERVPEYATAIPMTKTSRKRRADDPDAYGVQSNHRWLYSGRYALQVNPSTEFVAECCTRLGKSWEQVLGTLKHDLPMYADSLSEDYDRKNDERRILLETAGESVFSCEDQLIGEISGLGIYWCNLDGSPRCSTPWYRFMYGSIDDAALFITEERDPQFVNVVMPAEANANEMYALFENDKMDTIQTVGQLDWYLRHAKVDVDPYIKSLKAISTAAKIYAHFPHASVDVRILQQPLYDAFCVRTCISPSNGNFALFPEGSLQALQPYVLSDGQAFACLAMFESGQYNMDPNQLADVVAMCSGDSIFVRAALLADPHERMGSGEIRGLIGNIGRPGISFLVPPKAPLLKEVSLDEWPLIEHNEFDGCVLDNFQNTSLHLSFSGAGAPVNVGFTGGQDKVVCILEAVFSVYDGGRWMADLNISNLDGRTTTMLWRMPPCTKQHVKTTHAPLKLTCIDSWLGLMNAPAERVSLLRANRNWQARLAASSISLALGHETVILPHDVCWHCLYQHASCARFGKIIAIG
ncbi:MAG: hypothetical protein LQ352_002731 [Teloschistes flavicans]|nr:MAG: hypothetical protein LQ352_002731 [Teloschistes flavicans]